MDDLLYDALDVAVALRKVEGAELRRRLVVVGVRLELHVRDGTVGLSSENAVEETYDGVRAPLCPDDPAHCSICKDGMSMRPGSWRQTETRNPVQAGASRARRVHPAEFPAKIDRVFTSEHSATTREPP